MTLPGGREGAPAMEWNLLSALRGLAAHRRALGQRRNRRRHLDPIRAVVSARLRPANPAQAEVRAGCAGSTGKV